MKTYTREERERIIKYVLNNDVSFFDDMFEAAESHKLLHQCDCCLKYYIPKDMTLEDDKFCKSCHSSIDQSCEDEITYKEAYECIVRGR